MLLKEMLNIAAKAMLLGMGALAFAAPVAAGEPEHLRYFQYWSQYGDRLTPPGAYRNMSFSLSGGRVSIFFAGDGRSDNFVGPAEDDLNAELSRVISGLDFTNWDVPIDGKRSSDLSD